MFDSKIFEKDDQLLIKLAGDLDIYSEDKFRDFIEKNLENIDRRLVIDICDLDYLDSTGLGLFMKVYKLAKENDQDFTVINPKENIYKLFKITDLTEIFNME